MKRNCYNKETLLFTIYSYSGNLSSLSVTDKKEIVFGGLYWGPVWMEVVMVLRN